MSSIPVVAVPTQSPYPVPVLRELPPSRAPRTLIEVERAADEAIQLLCEHLVAAVEERNTLLAAAIALVEKADRSAYAECVMKDELDQLRAAIVALTTTEPIL